MAENEVGICRARLLSDLSGQTPCDKEATSLDGRLCAFHSRQCQAMYLGYKKRNAELDTLSENPPSYLATSKTSLVVQEFKDVDEEDVLRQLHGYIFKRYVLLERVIKARKLHHSHFYAVDMDYGHEKYLTKLLNEKHVMAKALERLGKRGAEVMYEQKEWLDWVKHCQEEEESQRENESKKVKLESLLFKRHQKEIEGHHRAMKAKENKKREEKYLQQAYQQRLSEMSDEEREEWDPMQDVFGYERDNYVDLLKFFLMLKDQDDSASEETESPSSNKDSEGATKEPEKTLSKSAKKRAKKANAETKKLNETSKYNADAKGSNTIEMETRAQMRLRLQTPIRYERSTGYYFDADNGPVGIHAQTHPLPDNEVDQLLDEIAEVKHFLFCRQLLSQAALLPIALRSNSIDEFLVNESVTQEHLRDLCLKLERPKLQDVRDACADFVRQRDGDAHDLDDEASKEDDEEEERRPKRKSDKYIMKFREHKTMPDKYQTKREKAAKKARVGPKEIFGEDEQDAIVNFGKVTDEKDYKHKRTFITICGRKMYHYPSEKALSRGGWYHFSVIAKDSSLFDAVELCRNWNEFFELNILCLHHFFPAPKWTRFIGDLLRQQLLQLGFIPYFLSDKADKVTHYFQTGSRGMARRAHQVVEMRNFICGNIKRDDAVSRRFIQYLSMETWDLRALVRDRKTGEVLIQPPEEELWLVREKSGWGRAAKNEFDNTVEVGPEFFEKMDTIRQWHFSFEEYYDVYIWDAAPGRSYHLLQRKLEETLCRAMRVRELKDMFSACAPIFKTITKDKRTERMRSIKPGEDVESLWDGLSTTAHAWRFRPKNPQDMLEGIDDSFKYTDADELEDSILFPEEGSGEMKDNLFRAKPSVMEMFEHRPSLDMRRFVEDLDSEEELSDEDDELYDDEGSEYAAQNNDKDPEWDTESEMNEDSDGDHEFITQEEADLEDNIDGPIDVLRERFRRTTIANKSNPDYFLGVLRSPESAASWIPEGLRERPAHLMARLRSAMKQQKDYDRSHIGIEADFMRHIEREKSKVFKHAWHMGDLSHNALRRYIEFQVMISLMDDFTMSKLTPGPFELCKLLNLAPQFTEERRIVDDAFTAYASIALFYDATAFLNSRDGDIFKDPLSKLLNQAERAKDTTLLDRRSWRSNKTMPKEFWREWDALLKEHKKEEGDEVDEIYPLEWRMAMRGAIVRLFKAGIICSSYKNSATGLAIAGTTTPTPTTPPPHPRDLYIDYRPGIPPAHIVSHLVDPTPLTPAHLLATVRKFQTSHPAARFSVLRMWSAPHFYPLMLGIERRPMVSFMDDRRRVWEWKFIPKDMPFSEWSVHQQLSLRLEPYRRVLGKDKVMVARDLILVMGEDEKECRRLSEAVTFAVQTRPWRLEIDFWRSFVGVDGEFVGGLDGRWLE
ncbi:hypothetical protein CC80DRAFT_462884 [Byssothecium circinans]|uniref:Uncharacterized protein n=1 Tax=Byssothecium circinans TaxID=147558 RepID=A0A6A5UKK2_9PLEO|nr:hypothetical protein CC80DRAFT_462884 [Byssothecium circinans]